MCSPKPSSKLYNADGEILQKAVEYYRIRSYGHPIVLATFAMTGAFRGIQNLRWGMWISILGAGVNLALNPVLIFGFGAIEGMGIAGSAWASLIAQVVMFGMAVFIMVRHTPFPLFPSSWHHPELLGLVATERQPLCPHHRVEHLLLHGQSIRDRIRRKRTSVHTASPCSSGCSALSSSMDMPLREACWSVDWPASGTGATCTG